MTFTNKMTFRGHSGAIYALDYDQKFIYSASADKYVVRWNIETKKQDSFAIKLTSTPFFIQLLDQNSKLLVGLSNGDIHFFNINKRKEIKYYQLHRNGIFSGLDNPQQQQFYVADGNGVLSIWDSNTLNLLLKLPFDCGKIRKIYLSANKLHLYLCCQDGKIRILDTNSFNLIYEWYTHNGGVATILEYGENILISAGKDAHIRIWDKETKENIKSIPAHNYMIYELLLLNNTTIVSASRDKNIKIWNAKTWEVIQRLDLKNGGHKHSVNKLIKIDDQTFVSASDDAQIILWSEK